jgi:hypothetical protein
VAIVLFSVQKLFDKLTVKPNNQQKCGSRGNLCVITVSLKTVFNLSSALYVLSLIRRYPFFADSTKQFEGFDPGSERTLAAWLRHASRTNWPIE